MSRSSSRLDPLEVFTPPAVRPTHIPVCRLSLALRKDRAWCWRKAKAGRYGKITYDAHARQQVEVAEVEREEAVTLDGDLLRAVVSPLTFKRSGPHLEPVPIKIPDSAASLTHDEIKTLIEAHLLVRDAQWRRYLARVEELTAETLESQSTFGDDHE
jgi:hypothetical protein